MDKMGLVDGCFYAFGGRSATLAGDRLGEGPVYFEWVKGPKGPIIFYTDICLEQAIDVPGHKVAWLIEPPGAGRTHYQRAAELHQHFEYVLTYNALEHGPNYLYCPLGGSWIKPEDWGLYRKDRNVSLILSDKQGMPGHQLRRQIYNEFQIDAYGRGVNPVASKLEALADYHYSVVVESCRLNYYFSEKLIDCLSCGTVPIYWGCPDIGRFFNLDGLITFETADELDYILLNVASERDYISRLPAIEDNLERARIYACAEDWIYKHYLFLFEGAK